MRRKEVRVPFADIQDSQKITDYNLQLYRENGMEMKNNECTTEDDPDRKERIMRLKPATKYFYSR